MNVFTQKFSRCNLSLVLLQEMANTPISEDGWHMAENNQADEKFKCSLKGIRASSKQKPPVPPTVKFSNSNLDEMNSATEAIKVALES